MDTKKRTPGRLPNNPGFEWKPDLLHIRRVQLGLTLQDLSHALRMRQVQAAPNTVSRYLTRAEHGGNLPNVRTARAIYEVLGLELPEDAP